jgi:hypothetical protein
VLKRYSDTHGPYISYVVYCKPCADEGALEALEQCGLDDTHRSYEFEHVARIALRAALAQQEQAEPVLVVEKEPDYMSRGHFYEGSKPFIDPTLVWKLPIGTKLYTAPPRREWRSLSEEEIIDAVRESDLDWQRGWTLEDSEPNRYTQLARAIEAKLKEKNHG